MMNWLRRLFHHEPESWFFPGPSRSHEQSEWRWAQEKRWEPYFCRKCANSYEMWSLRAMHEPDEKFCTVCDPE